MCNCNSNKRTYEVTKTDGKKVEVKSQYEAIAMVRKEGGTWRIKA